MRVNDWLEWIAAGCGREEEGLLLLQAALKELLEQDPDQVDPRVARLRELEKRPLDYPELERLRQDWEEISLRAEALKLEAEFRRIARSLPAESWQTDLFRSLVALHRDFQAGLEAEVVAGAAAELGAFVEDTWRNYQEMPIAPEEITLETLVAHQLLSESFQFWQTSFDMACEAVADSALWEQALRIGQQASRHLVAVQLLDRRIQAATARYGK
ncbi:MAG: hypothetical protein KF760_08935 [Candidatus Eremiobacteraeota bacterium]|nr:hypothetical protein [Candidatus Eremiobacteraeota bacterium]MCW5869058.1 hypothetical protein [Candidatus Eremiobacteraeota bacterium]